ncbi:SDR family oxidoreductase [Sphingomonas oryzagri]
MIQHPDPADKIRNDPARWSGKVAMVTGATTGIGEAIAYDLAGLGMKLLLVGRRSDQLERVAAVIRDDGGNAASYPCDLGDANAIPELFARAAREAGGLDVLVNNAGVGYKSGIANFSTADLQQVLDVNVLGAALCIREALALFGDRPNTAIITISSLAAHRVPPGGFGLYAASKHALRAIMEALRTELIERGSPTKVASISPGTVATEFHKLFSRSDEDPTDRLPFERLSPRDIADAVTYLLCTPAHVQINDVLVRPMGQMG